MSKLLSVIIPVYDIEDHVPHLAGELSKLDGIDAEVIVVDDGSRDGTVAALRAAEIRVRDLTIIESGQNAGAGVARNIGFPQATGRFTLFFDGDDDLHAGAIVETMNVLEESGADASINRYEFIRDGQSESTGMNVIDRVLWKEYIGAFPGGILALEDAPRFLEFTNYPWNKIIRTDHYQARGLDPFFGPTRVNNDILGHWNILLHAGRIALVDKTIVTHHVSGGRDHLSNRFGRERLELIDALGSVREILQGDPALGARYAAVYWSLVRRLVIWAESKLRPEVKPEFARAADALAREVSFADLLAAHRSDAAVYRWLIDRIG